MKKLIAVFFAVLSFSAAAETCTYVMKDYYGNTVQRFTRFAYSYYAACDEAQYDCKEDLAERQVRGGWYGLICREEITNTYPAPYPPSYPPSYPPPYPPSYPPSYPPPYPPSYPPRDPHFPRDPYPREPREPRYPREPREPRYPRDPRPHDPHYPRGPR